MMYRERKPIDVGPYDHPDIYPGPRPPASFIYSDGMAHRVEEKVDKQIDEWDVKISSNQHLLGSFAFSTEETKTIGEFLAEKKLESIDNLVPLLAYGSNVCLAQMKYKFSLNSELNDVTICLRATMKDSDIVYGSFLAPYGSLPAIIAPVKGAETEVWITLVEKEQLLHMNQTEGGYELREHKLKKIKTASGVTFDTVYCYYYPNALSFNETMSRFRDIPGESPLPSVWQADMLDELRKKFDFKGTREYFLHLLRWDINFKEKINTFLKQFNEGFNHPDWQIPSSPIKTIEEMKKD